MNILLPLILLILPNAQEVWANSASPYPPSQEVVVYELRSSPTHHVSDDGRSHQWEHDRDYHHGQVDRGGWDGYGGHHHQRKGGSHFDRWEKERGGHGHSGHDSHGSHHHHKWKGSGGKKRKEGNHYFRDKGHKRHGFKNVYHKEEYADHKSYHDILRDRDYHQKHRDHRGYWDLHGGKYHRLGRAKDHHHHRDYGRHFHKYGREKEGSRAGHRYQKGGKYYRQSLGHRKDGAHHYGAARTGGRLAHPPSAGSHQVFSFSRAFGQFARAVEGMGRQS